MTKHYNYQQLLKTSRRVNWRVEDIIGNGRRMDFSLPFLPEAFARTQALPFLTRDERLTLNHIRAHGYLAMFELVERSILPYIEEHLSSTPGSDAFRTPALSQFADEESKHIELFVAFRREFTEDFGAECAFIGPAEQIGAAIRAHSALALAIFVLAIEWATQQHYLESVRNDQSLDPQFKSLLKNHWIEESQHVKLDTLMFYEFAKHCAPEEIDRGVDDFLQIGAFIDEGLRQQAEFDVATFENVSGRQLDSVQHAEWITVQHQAMRYTFLGSAMRNPMFLEALGSVSPSGRARIEEVAPAFC